MTLTPDDRAKLLALLDHDVRQTVALDLGVHRAELRAAARERVAWLRRMREALLEPEGVLQLPASPVDAEDDR